MWQSLGLLGAGPRGALHLLAFLIRKQGPQPSSSKTLNFMFVDNGAELQMRAHPG